MSGEELFEAWAQEFCKRKVYLYPATWDDLDAIEKRVWSSLAKKLLWVKGFKRGC